MQGFRNQDIVNFLLIGFDVSEIKYKLLILFVLCL